MMFDLDPIPNGKDNLSKKKLKDALDSLKGFSKTELRQILDEVESKLSSNDVSEILYEHIRSCLINRMSQNDLTTLCPWRQLSQHQKKEFSTTYERSRRKLIDIGLSEQKSHQISASILLERTEGVKQFSFQKILEHLESIPVYFDASFPRYRSSPEAIQLLNSR